MNDLDLAHKLIWTAGSITRRFDASLSAIKGITYSEFQLLSAIAQEASPTRVLLAQRVGLTPSGVTRALKPLERLGYVETVRDARDARRSIAVLTSAGEELLSDATEVVNDTVGDLKGLSDLSDDAGLAFSGVLDALGAY